MVGSKTQGALDLLSAYALLRSIRIHWAARTTIPLSMMESFFEYHETPLSHLNHMLPSYHSARHWKQMTALGCRAHRVLT